MHVIQKEVQLVLLEEVGIFVVDCFPGLRVCLHLLHAQRQIFLLQVKADKSVAFQSGIIEPDADGTNMAEVLGDEVLLDARRCPKSKVDPVDLSFSVVAFDGVVDVVAHVSCLPLIQLNVTDFLQPLQSLEGMRHQAFPTLQVEGESVLLWVPPKSSVLACLLEDERARLEDEFSRLPPESTEERLFQMVFRGEDPLFGMVLVIVDGSGSNNLPRWHEELIDHRSDFGRKTEEV